MESKNFCPECGCKLDAGVKFCPECGFNLRTEEAYRDNAAVVVQAAAPTSPTVITQQTNACNANDNENEFLIKKQNAETAECKISMQRGYIGALVCALGLILVVVFVEGGWVVALFKWAIIVPVLLFVAISLLSTASIMGDKYKKVSAMSLIEYKHELAKRERNKEMAVDAAKDFAKGFAQAYIREKFRNY